MTDHWIHKELDLSKEFPGFVIGWRETEDDFALKSNIDHAIVRHSPDGFNVGYGGSGPAEFALNILLSVMGREPSPSLYQDFKREFIATVLCKPGEMILISIEKIEAWIKKKEGVV